MIRWIATMITTFDPPLQPIYSGWWMPEGANLSKATLRFHGDYVRRQRPFHRLSETYIKLKKAKVSAEMHIYSEGGHGYGLRAQRNP